MASHGVSGKPLMPKLTLEDYLNLEHMDVIPASVLRKILTIHGFRSVTVPKLDLIDAVRSIELMEAHHSTLQSDVSSNAFLSMNEVIKDISLLNWHECCITSIETINSVTEFGSGAGEQPLPKRLKPNCSMASDTTQYHDSPTTSCQKMSQSDDPKYHESPTTSSQKMARSDDPVTSGKARRIRWTPARYHD